MCCRHAGFVGVSAGFLVIYIYIYIYTYVYLCTCIYVHIHNDLKEPTAICVYGVFAIHMHLYNTYVCMNVCVWICTYIRTYLYTYTFKYVYLYIYIHTCIYIYIYTHICTFIYVYIHVHILIRLWKTHTTSAHIHFIGARPQRMCVCVCSYIYSFWFIFFSNEILHTNTSPAVFISLCVIICNSFTLSSLTIHLIQRWIVHEVNRP